MTRDGQAAGLGFDATTRSVMPSAGVVEARLLRHGEVAHFGKRGVRGQADVPLTARGRSQHQALTRWLAAHTEPPELVICSDLSRCRELGQAIADAHRVPLVLDPRLREQDMGQWEGCTWSEISAEHGRAVNDYWDDYVNAAPPGGESLSGLAQRALAAWQEHVLADALHEGSTRRVVLVSHIGVIRSLLCHALGLGLDQALRFSPAAASVSSLLLAQAGAVLQGLGERPWMLDAPAPERPLSACPRIALSGSAGTGKSTLGRRLADALGVPFIEEPMRARLEDGLNLHSMSHSDLRALMLEIWAEQRAAEDDATEGFVADRSSADFAAFWIHYGFHHDAEDTEPRMAEWLAALPRYDRVLLCPWGVLPLVNDGIRSTNRWIQFMFQSLVEGLLSRHAAPGQVLSVPPTVDLEQRVGAVLEALQVAQA